MTSTPTDAATILLVRDGSTLEVLMVQRHAELVFAPGALVFPGGKVEAEDGDEAWAEHALGWAQVEPQSRTLRLCAAREAFEETGILLGHGDGGGADDVDALRKALHRGEASFREVVDRLGVVLDLLAIVPFARWITPERSPIRFDATFFVARAPADQLASCDGWETVAAEWLTPTAALDLADAGERLLMHPTRMTLQRLSASSNAAEAIASARIGTVTAQQRD